MLPHRLLLFLLACILSFTCAPGLRAQEIVPTPHPSPRSSPPSSQEQEQIKIFTEEVRLPVVAFDDFGHFDPSLELDDILVLEEGVPQQIRSVRRIPGNVLLLLDTGNQLTLAKSVDTTRAVVARLLAALRGENQVAVLQFNERVELLQDWTTEKEAIPRILQTKLFSGKRSRLSDAIIAAVGKLQDRTAGSRHVVIITDGVETPGGKVSYAEAVKQLVAAQATVHVISYTAMVQLAIKEQYKRKLFSTGNGRPRDGTPGGQDPTLPPGMTRSPSFTLGSIDMDRQMRRWYKKYAESVKESEQRLTSLVAETGGRMMLPTDTETMLAQGEEVARDIGAQYVVTYTPQRPLAQARAGEYRRVEVAPRKTGVRLRSRRGYVVTLQ